MKVDLQQNSAEWHAFRNESGRINGTDISCLMGCNPWKSARQLWREKMGLIDKEPENFHMKRGKNLENEARDSFSKRIGIHFEPEVHVHPIYSWCSASLDGINPEADTLLEIKCPVRHHESIPEHYKCQIQWQFFVSGATKCYFVSYIQAEIVFYEEKRDDAYIEILFKKAFEFRRMILDFEEPPATEKEKEDLQVIEDQEMSKLIVDYEISCYEFEKFKSMKEELREKIIQKTNGKNSIAFGLKICKIVKPGSIDYKKIPELENIDTGKFRGPNIESWRLSR